MAAQSVALGRNYAPAFIWRGLLVLRAMGGGIVAGMVAGFFAGGVGARLAMKIVAVVGGADARGRITENGNRIGDFTASGTLFLLLFGATLGTIGGLLYIALRPWLAGAGRWRGLAFGAVLLATARAGTLDAENFDFSRFGNPALNVALFAALPLAFGLIVAPCADWLDRRVPMPSFDSVGALGLAGGLGSAALMLIPAALLAGFVARLDPVPTPLVLATLLPALSGYVVLGAQLFPAGGWGRIPRIGGYLLTTAAGVLGFVVLALMFAGLVLNSEEAGSARLTAAMLLLLFALGGIGQLWLARDGKHARGWLAAAPLAVPVLVGLAVTLREVGAILFGA